MITENTKVRTLAAKEGYPEGIIGVCQRSLDNRL